MKIEAAVFPFHKGMLPFVRHFNLDQETYHICQALAWNGLGLKGQDAALICCHPDIGVPVVSPSEPDLFLDWHVLLVDYDALEQTHSTFDSFAFFNQLLSAGKELIVATGQDISSIAKRWDALCHEYPGQIQILTSKHRRKMNTISGSNEYKLLSVPVLIVGGLITQEDCLEIILSLRASFMRQGVTVSCLTGSNMGLLMGTHSYTHIFDKANTLSAADKAVVFNMLAQDIIKAERPSLLIVEAPDPMLKYNNVAPNGFGLLTYLACQALRPDMLVCSVPPDLATEESFLKHISRDFEVRYGMPITAVHVNNIIIDSFYVLQFHTISRVHAKLDLLSLNSKREKKNYAFPVYNVISDGTDELAQYILHQEEFL